jgi:hypothetical protein
MSFSGGKSWESSRRFVPVITARRSLPDSKISAKDYSLLEQKYQILRTTKLRRPPSRETIVVEDIIIDNYPNIQQLQQNNNYDDVVDSHPPRLLREVEEPSAATDFRRTIYSYRPTAGGGGGRGASSTVGKSQQQQAQIKIVR